jgi:hypothetical protein
VVVDVAKAVLTEMRFFTDAPSSAQP